MALSGRFLCDEMLGKLARDLRLLGYDTAYARDVRDEHVLHRARDEGRLLLTRDRDLAQSAGEQGFLVTSLDPDEQLDEVVGGLRLAPTEAMFLSRCTRCGGLLEEAEGEEAPERVREVVDAFQRCAACGHLYWEGTHVEDMRRRLGRFHAKPRHRDI